MATIPFFSHEFPATPPICLSRLTPLLLRPGRSRSGSRRDGRLGSSGSRTLPGLRPGVLKRWRRNESSMTQEPGKLRHRGGCWGKEEKTGGMLAWFYRLVCIFGKKNNLLAPFIQPSSLVINDYGQYLRNIRYYDCISLKSNCHPMQPKLFMFSLQWFSLRRQTDSSTTAEQSSSSEMDTFGEVSWLNRSPYVTYIEAF